VADLGFEHLFTGHGGILAPAVATNPFDNSDHPIEKTFRSWMSVEANRKIYAGKTSENIQHLMNWVESISRACRWSAANCGARGRKILKRGSTRFWLCASARSQLWRIEVRQS